MKKTNPMTRWLRGHHLFFALNQALTFTLRRFEAAASQEDYAQAEAELQTATDLMWAAAAALRFSGDMTPEDYMRTVRPSMTPPRVHDGFSGLDSTDHRHMVKALNDLKPIFRNLPPQLEVQRRRFKQALTVAFNSHLYVCERFVDAEAKSILGDAKDTGNSALNTLDIFKQNRLRSVDPNADRVPTCPAHGN